MLLRRSRKWKGDTLRHLDAREEGHHAHQHDGPSSTIRFRKRCVSRCGIESNSRVKCHALIADMQDFGQLSSKTVAEVLMLEIKMSPGAKVFLVSGYPRNMRDVVEYAEKVSRSLSQHRCLSR